MMVRCEACGEMVSPFKARQKADPVVHWICDGCERQGNEAK